MNLSQKFFYSWLIFCLGGVDPLIYFDGFMPGHEHGEHPYHVSIFEEASHHESHPPQPEVLAEQLSFELLSQLNPHLPLLTTTPPLTPGFSRFFTSGLSKGYVLTATPPMIFNLPFLFRPAWALSITGQSTFLAPPDKPPSVYPV